MQVDVVEPAARKIRDLLTSSAGYFPTGRSRFMQAVDDGVVTVTVVVGG